MHKLVVATQFYEFIIFNKQVRLQWTSINNRNCIKFFFYLFFWNNVVLCRRKMTLCALLLSNTKWVGWSLNKYDGKTLGVNFTNVFCAHFLPALFVRSYEKFASLTLMTLTVGVNFINVIWARFSYKSAFL